MKIKTNMILNEKQKIVINVISTKEIVIEHKFNRGIENYIRWLKKHNVDLSIIIEENKTIIKSNCGFKIFAPNFL